MPGGGITPGPLPRECPTGCAQSICDTVYDRWKDKWDACTTTECKSSIQQQYRDDLAVSCARGYA